MPGDSTTSGNTYSPWVGLTYVFNLIVGTGALTLPAAFAHAGWAISLWVILALGFISYVTLTFVVETMAVANAIMRQKEERRHKRVRVRERKREQDSLLPESSSESEESEVTSPTRSLLEHVKVRKKAGLRGHYNPSAGESRENVSSVLVVGPSTSSSVTAISVSEDNEEPLENCDIKETVEMAKMAGMFFSTTGSVLFFICIAVYLYGDLAIYGAAVGKSLRDTICDYYPKDVPCNATLNGTVACWEGSQISRDSAYRMFLTVFVVVIGSFGFFNVQKTMLLQILTTMVRWSAFIVMIVLACIRLATYTQDQLGHPSAADAGGIPNLFGACVYSFMCHHSLPSLVTPISPKRRLYRFLMADYFLIAAFYLLLALTGVFAFQQLEDLYTLNFVPNRCPETPSATVAVLATIFNQNAGRAAEQFLFYFLALFPVFTLSTSFPIILITLRNNLKQLFLGRDDSEHSFFVRRLFFPLLALIPPAIIALITSDVQFLVGVTGSYAGVGVQYVVPAFLVYYSRKALAQEFGSSPVLNSFASPFKHVAFIIFVLIWAVLCMSFVTYNHIVLGK